MRMTIAEYLERRKAGLLPLRHDGPPKVTPALKRKHYSEWQAWQNARYRCHNPRHPGYANYGGRGIQMAASWRRSFDDFLAHIGPKPDPTLTLDRIDNGRGYEPGNVRWATKSEQALNRRRKTSLP